MLSAGTGTGPGNRYIIATNAVVIITGFFTLVYYIVFLAFGLFFPGWLYFLWFLNILGYAFVLWLNITGRNKSVRILLSISGWSQLLIISRILSPSAGLDLYILASFALPFYIYPPEEKIFIFVTELALGFLFVLARIIPYFFDPILELASDLQDYFYFTSIILVVLWLTFLGKELASGAWEAERLLQEEKDKSERLLLNILPKETAEELKRTGYSEPKYISEATVLFTDFYGFTSIAENLSPDDLVRELDTCFRHFDSVTEVHNLEKLKTIGDAYMCVAGVPSFRPSHAVDSLLTALGMLEWLDQMRTDNTGAPLWKTRIGIHSGPLVAGVIGSRKFSYDVWGDTVNLASRMESSSEPGRVNVTRPVVELTKDFFVFRSRGSLPVKNKGDTRMYFLARLRPEFREGKNPRKPNRRFWKLYELRFNGNAS